MYCMLTRDKKKQCFRRLIWPTRYMRGADRVGSLEKSQPLGTNLLNLEHRRMVPWGGGKNFGLAYMFAYTA